MTDLCKLNKNQIEYLLINNNDPAIAKQFGVTRQAVYAIRKKFNIPARRINTKMIIEMKRQGKSVSKISTVTGVSISYIYKVLKNGINSSEKDTSRS